MIEGPNMVTPEQRELFDRIDEIHAGRKCAQSMHAAIESLAMFINHIDSKGAGTFFSGGRVEIRDQTEKESHTVRAAEMTVYSSALGIRVGMISQDRC